MNPVSFYGIIAIAFSLAVTVIWIVIGWRAMRAHESLAESHSDLQREIKRLAGQLSSGIDKVDSNKLPRFKE